MDGKLVPSSELTGTFEPFPDSLLDTCEMIPGGYSKCNPNVFEPICFEGVKTMQSPCHAQVMNDPQGTIPVYVIRNYTVLGA